MRILFFRYVFLFFCILFLLPQKSPSLQAQNPQLHVSAAVSTKEALAEITSLFEKKHQIRISLNLGASGTLVSQILAGAPCDALLSADHAVIARLIEHGVLKPTEVSNLLSNALVIAQRKDFSPKLTNPADLQQTSIKRIALGKPGIVPAGTYAEKWLQKLGLWDELKPKFVYTPHVRAATASLSLGNVEAAIAYQTDVQHQTDLCVSYRFPPDQEPKILYPFGILSASIEKPEVLLFRTFLHSEEVRQIFEKHGFLPLGK